MSAKKTEGSLKILFVGPEAAPFVKIGGLGEFLYALPKALIELGHDARVMLPRYPTIDSEKFPMTLQVEGLHIPNTEQEDIICNVKKYTSDTPEEPIAYFLENEEYFEKRGSVYGYDDDAARWALLSRGVIEFIRQNKDWQPDIIVANDWQGGLVPNYMKTAYKDDPIISQIAGVFIIHNLHFQGMFDHHHSSELDFDDGQSRVPAITDPRLLKINFMRRGIRFADMISTVSPNYAREITTPEYGELLDKLLQERRSHLSGILNGISYERYNPEANVYVEYKYSEKSLQERIKNKKILQQKFNLPERKDVFVAAMVTRLTEQKGIDLVTEMIEPLLNNFDFQFVVVGTGESKYLSFFEELDKKYPQVATHLSFDEILPHVVYAGADMIIIPSRFEPSGLTQMEAMRYGLVPLVRKTGGLADSVEDYSPQNQSGTGFVFEHYDRYGFFGTFVRAFENYKYPPVWHGIQKRAMQANFSWEKSAKEYIELFRRALNQFNIK
ncbi:MAG TPA: glycogen/starch synthase [Methylomirabilota bacterium]|nr:glycogen/starch synthase [Methylomirabilota bacterium]